MAEGKPWVLLPYILLSCVVAVGLRVCKWWSIMTQERLIYHENMRDGESGYNQEDLASSLNISFV